MTVSTLCCQGSVPSTRIYMSALIALVFICTFSCCSSSSEFLPESPTGNLLKEAGDMGIEKNVYDQHNHVHPLPSRSSSSSMHHVNDIKNLILSRNHLLHLLLDPDSIQVQDISRRRNQDRFTNRRYASQAFHAMRG